MEHVNHVLQPKCKMISTISKNVCISLGLKFLNNSILCLVLQFDSMETKKIQIKSHPREKFRPRTQNERKSASHYIRCEQNSPDEYPSIYVCFV